MNWPDGWCCGAFKRQCVRPQGLLGSGPPTRSVCFLGPALPGSSVSHNTIKALACTVHRGGLLLLKWLASSRLSTRRSAWTISTRCSTRHLGSDKTCHLTLHRTLHCILHLDLCFALLPVLQKPYLVSSAHTGVDQPGRLLRSQRIGLEPGG